QPLAPCLSGFPNTTGNSDHYRPGAEPAQDQHPKAAYSGRNSHSMSCRGAQHDPKKGTPRPERHTNLTGGLDRPHRLPPREGNHPSCLKPDLRPLAATSSAPGSERAEWEPCGVPGTPPCAATWPSKKSSCP